MKARMDRNSSTVKVLAALALALGAGGLRADTLTWNGGTSASAWDFTTASWLNSSSQAAVWSNGSRAAFTGNATLRLADGVSAAGLDFSGASATVTLTNGTLELVSPATVTAGNAAAVIASPLSGTNGLAVTGGMPLYAPFLTRTNVTVFTGLSLGDVAAIRAQVDGAQVAGPYDASPYYFSNDGETATVQLQFFKSRSGATNAYTKCVKVQLTQSGSDILGKVLYAKVIDEKGTNHLGANFDVTGVEQGVAYWATDGGYGAFNLQLATAASAGRGLQICGNAALTGTVSVAAGASLAFAGDGRLNGGLFSGAIANNGVLAYGASGGQMIGSSGKLTGSGMLIVTGDGSAVTNLYTGYVPTSSTVLFRNVSLAQVSEISGIMQGAQIARREAQPYSYLTSSDGKTATVQLQVSYTADGVEMTKCVKIELTQSGSDIAAQAVYARYKSGLYPGNDFDTWYDQDMAVATSDSAGGYGIHDFALIVKPNLAFTHTAVNTCSGGMYIRNGMLRAFGTSALPTSGDIQVGAGGVLYFGVQYSGSIGGENEIDILPGGKVVIANANVTGGKRLFSINGGVLECQPSVPIISPTDCRNYINFVRLANGAQVTGHAIRVGNVFGPVVRATGSAPSTLASGINMVNSSVAGNLALNVDDVTGDDSTDLFITGPISDYNSDSEHLGGLKLVKAFAGTVSFAGENSYTGITEVAEGTIALDSDSAILGPVVLAGGSLAAGTHTNACGTLTLSASGSIALGTGSLAFAASSGKAWASGAALNLTGTLGEKSLRFGTNAAGLTEAQLGQIHCGGHKVCLNKDGYIVLYGGTSYTLR